MATEIVNDAPKAFAGWDSSIYTGWLKAMSDMMLTKGDPTAMHSETLANYGGLMNALTEALEELQERDRQAHRARQLAEAA